MQAGENLLHIFCFCAAPHNKVVAPPLILAGALLRGQRPIVTFAMFIVNSKMRSGVNLL